MDSSVNLLNIFFFHLFQSMPLISLTSQIGQFDTPLETLWHFCIKLNHMLLGCTREKRKHPVYEWKIESTIQCVSRWINGRAEYREKNGIKVEVQVHEVDIISCSGIGNTTTTRGLDSGSLLTTPDKNSCNCDDISYDLPPIGPITCWSLATWLKILEVAIFNLTHEPTHIRPYCILGHKWVNPH